MLDAEAWCSGLTCGPVKAEIAGSNPVASAPVIHALTFTVDDESTLQLDSWLCRHEWLFTAILSLSKLCASSFSLANLTSPGYFLQELGQLLKKDSLFMGRPQSLCLAKGRHFLRWSAWLQQNLVV